MLKNNITIIGIDGGATKVAASTIDVHGDKSFTLGSIRSEKAYRDYPEFDPGYTPVDIKIQLREMQNNIQPTSSEVTQAKAYLSAFIDAIENITSKCGSELYLIGIGLPGLKTSDKRGIAAMANGPRMPEFADQLEKELNKRNIPLLKPIFELGSDADHCGIGEEYASSGLFKGVSNAYYLGGGTGAADAMKLNDKLLPFDKVKDWIAKTWEMKNDNNISLENFASAGGIQTIYSRQTGISVEDLNANATYPDTILQSAIEGDADAAVTFYEVSHNLARLIYERITTIYAGWQSYFKFVNPNRPALKQNHSFSGSVLDRIIFGQRLADLICQSKNTDILWKPFLAELTQLITQSQILSDKAKTHYLGNNRLEDIIIQTSELRDAPIIGAGVDSYLNVEDAAHVGIELTPGYTHPSLLDRWSTPSKKEPVIKVGVVLPEDKQTSIRLSFPNPDNYFIEGHECHNLQDTADINLIDGSVCLSTIQQNKIIIRRKRIKDDLTDLVKLDSVVAGRGFHWQKQISVQYPGDLEITIKNDSLLIINYIPAELYLMCVATSEMSSACPPQLTEAQTIVARSWLLAAVEKKHADLGIDVCNDDCCQRYQGISCVSRQLKVAQKTTSGLVLMFDDNICDARYSKCCGGQTESFENVWKGHPHPYLQSKPDMPNESGQTPISLTQKEHADKWIRSAPKSFCSPAYISDEDIAKYLGNVDVSESYYRWNISYSQYELSYLLSGKLDLSIKAVLDIILLRRGSSTRLTLIEIKFMNENDEIDHIQIASEYEIRRILHPKFLYSSAFVIDKCDVKNDIPGRFNITGAGWGHGVGLCQIGGLSMALHGRSSDSILKHYYPGTTLKKLY